MLDLEKIAPCLPGAAIQEEVDDGEYAGTIKVEIGPITVSYKGTVKFEETNESAHRAVLQATGREARGQGTATATIVSTLHDEGDNTRVNVETDMLLTGRVARFGRGLAQDVAKRMLDDFAVCLEREISGGDTAEPVPEIGLVTGVTAEGSARSAAVVGSTSDKDTSSEDPAVAAGGTVEGAIVAGSSPSEAAASAPTSPVQQPKTQEIPRRKLPEEPEPLDPGGSSKNATPKRLTPVLAGIGALLVLLWLLRRRR